MNRKILMMLVIASFGLPIQFVITSVYPASEFSFVYGLSLAIFGIIAAIMIVLYSKVRKEIPRE